MAVVKRCWHFFLSVASIFFITFKFLVNIKVERFSVQVTKEILQTQLTECIYILTLQCNL